MGGWGLLLHAEEEGKVEMDGLRGMMRGEIEKPSRKQIYKKTGKTRNMVLQPHV